MTNNEAGTPLWDNDKIREEIVSIISILTGEIGEYSVQELIEQIRDEYEQARAADAQTIAELERMISLEMMQDITIGQLRAEVTTLKEQLKEARHKNVNLQFIIDVNQLSKEAYEPTA